MRSDTPATLFEALHANDAEKVVAAFDGLRATLTERAERAEAAHDNQVEQYLHLHDATKADAALGAALRAALAELYQGGGEVIFSSVNDEIRVVATDFPCQKYETRYTDATRALAALLRSSASTERTT